MAERFQAIRSVSWWIWLTALGVLGALERGLLAMVYGPIHYGDTPTYFRLADVLMKSGLSSYDATRVPGYPLFIGLLGQDERLVWICQLILGLLISLLAFFIIFQLTRQASLAFVVGMIYNFSAGPFLFEFNLLSETLTAFLLTLSFSLFLWSQSQENQTIHYGSLFVLGIISGLTGLVRTLFFFLPVILLPFVMSRGADWRQRIRLGAVFSLGPVLLLGGWVYFVYDHYAVLSPTTMGGYHLVQHTGAFFERLPDSEATIRDIYLEYRDQRLAERGVQTNAIWEAIPALSQATGLSFFALSEKMQELSVRLILENPRLYLRSVLDGWISFWKAPVYWDPSQFTRPLPFLRYWPLLARGLALAANACFLLLSAGAVFSRKVRTRLNPPQFILGSAALIWFSSILQTLVDHGDNPRFLVPLQLLVFIIVVWVAWKIGGHRRRSE